MIPLKDNPSYSLDTKSKMSKTTISDVPPELLKKAIQFVPDIYRQFIPETIGLFDKKPMHLTMPYEICVQLIQAGHLDCLKYYIEKNDYRDKNNDMYCKTACEFGHLDILQWLKNENYKSNPKILRYAIINGHLHILQWAIANGYELCAHHYEDAAKSGNLQILLFLKENCCPKESISPYLYATMSGHLHILKWLRENGHPWRNEKCASYDIILIAISKGIFEIVKWLVNNKCPPCHEKNRPFVCQNIAKTGNLPLLKWARENEYVWNHNTTSNAAEHGHFEMLKWAFENGCELHRDIFSKALKSNDLEIVKWIHANKHVTNYELDLDTCENFLKNGNLEMLKWIIKNGYKLPNGVFTKAIESNNLEIVKLVHVDISDMIRPNTCTKMIKIGNLEMLQWLVIENGFHVHREIVCKAAAKYGQLDILKWARENEFPWDEKVCENAAENGHVGVLRWAHENGCPWSEKIYEFIIEWGDLETLKWLHENGCPWNNMVYNYVLEHCYYGIVECYYGIIEWIRTNGLLQ